MVFPKLKGPHYVKRTRVFLNSNERVPIESRDGWTFTFDLPEEVNQVIGIELVQYNVPKDAGPTFSGSYDFENFLYLDFENYGNESNAQTPTEFVFSDEGGTPSFKQLGDLDPGYSFFGVPVTLPTSEYVLPISLLYGILFTDIGVRATAVDNVYPVGLPDPYSEVDHRTIGLTEVIDFTFETNTIPIRYADISFQYKTGGTGNISAQVFGFHPYRDSVPTAARHVRGDYMMNSRPFRYLDIFVDEMTELEPVARVWVVDEDLDNYVTSENPPNKMRLLLNPVPRLRKMRVRARLAQRRYPPTIADTGMDLIFDVYSLAPVESVPDWIQQAFYL